MRKFCGLRQPIQLGLFCNLWYVKWCQLLNIPLLLLTLRYVVKSRSFGRLDPSQLYILSRYSALSSFMPAFDSPLFIFYTFSITYCKKSCRLSQVIILGHSIGGYVSRLVPILYPETRPYIRSIVTLGSPHAYPVFGFEATLHELHRTYLAPSISPTISTSKGVEEDKHQHVLVAVSGGLRDEMIPPVACSTQNIPNSLSVSNIWLSTTKRFALLRM